MLTHYEPNAEWILEKNPLYWGGANGVQPTPRLNKIIDKFVPDGLTRSEDLQRRSANMVVLDFSLVSQTVAVPGVYVPNFGTTPTFEYMGLDTQKFPFSNTLIRQAVVHSINYTAILSLFHGFGVSFVGPSMLGLPGYPTDLQPYSYNITLAEQLLVKAGYPNGQGLPTITILARQTSLQQQMLPQLSART
jgi:ABC-type transport system substrate-binding protein